MSGSISANGIAATTMRLEVPFVGPWHAEVRFAEPPGLVGPVALAIDGQSWLGTVVPEQSGQFATRATLTVIGGRAGWRQTVGAKHLHSDGGFQRSQIATDVALEVGETVVVAPEADGFAGFDFARLEGPASRVLEQLFPDHPWWVDELGVTHVGTHPPRDVSTLVQVLAHDPRNRTATLSVDRVADAVPGCSITDPRLESLEPFVVHDLVFEVSGGAVRAHVHASEQRDGRLLALIKGLVERSLPTARLQGLYRYQVVSADAQGRLTLQAVVRTIGLPDLASIVVAPGVAGASSTLVPGAIVGVQFYEGDPARPVVTLMPVVGSPGFAPTLLQLEGTALHIGGEETANPAIASSEKRFVRYGDAVQVGSTGGAMTLVSGTMSRVGTVLP